MINKKLIVTVCRGNIARSPLAEKVIKRELTRQDLNEDYEVISRGTQGVDPEDMLPVKFSNITEYSIYQNLKPWLDKHNVDLTSHRSTPIDMNVAERANLILAMDEKTQRTLLRMFPGRAKIIHLFSELVGENKSIIDPDGTEDRLTQEQTFTEIEDIITRGFKSLLTLTDNEGRVVGKSPEKR